VTAVLLAIVLCAVGLLAWAVWHRIKATPLEPND
jgi:hypothetical protein